MTSCSGAGLVLLDIVSMSRPEIRVCAEACSRVRLPVLALVTRAGLTDFASLPAIDDFVLVPPDAAELVTRAKLLVARTRSHEGPDVVRVRELVINPTTYEVSLKGKRINLRFKEYELLRLLAANPGRVYTRDALLRQVWGFDYFGEVIDFAGYNPHRVSALETGPQSSVVVDRVDPLGQLVNYLVGHHGRHPAELYPGENSGQVQDRCPTMGLGIVMQEEVTRE